MDNGTISEEVDLSIEPIRNVYSVQTIEPTSSQDIQSHICMGLNEALPIMSNFKSSTKTSIPSSASLSVSLCLFSDPGVSLRVLLEEFRAIIDGIASASSAQHLVYPVFPEMEKMMFPAELGPRDTRIHEIEGSQLNGK